MIQDLLYDVIKEDFKTDELKFKKDIEEAVNEHRFSWLFKGNEAIGFYTWVEKWVDDKKYIYIGNFFIYKEFRNFLNLVNLRKEFKYRFGEVRRFYWHSQKKDKFIYIKGE